MSCRLARDLYPLSSQVRFACLRARESIQRLRGEPLPQFYLHLVTAHAILCHHGVPLGKADDVPHMVGRR